MNIANIGRLPLKSELRQFADNNDAIRHIKLSERKTGFLGRLSSFLAMRAEHAAPAAYGQVYKRCAAFAAGFSRSAVNLQIGGIAIISAFAGVVFVKTYGVGIDKMLQSFGDRYRQFCPFACCKRAARPLRKYSCGEEYFV